MKTFVVAVTEIRKEYWTVKAETKEEAQLYYDSKGIKTSEKSLEKTFSVYES